MVTFMPTMAVGILGAIIGFLITYISLVVNRIADYIPQEKKIVYCFVGAIIGELITIDYYMWFRGEKLIVIF